MNPNVMMPIQSPLKAQMKFGARWDGDAGGDPHLRGLLHHERYDVHGESGNWYNLLSFPGFQWNAKFQKIPVPGRTVIQDNGFLIGDAQLRFNLKDNTLTLQRTSNSPVEVLQEGEPIEIKNGYTVIWQAKPLRQGILTIHTPQLDFQLKPALLGTPFAYLSVRSKVSLHEPKGYDNIHGLLGQTGNPQHYEGITLPPPNGDRHGKAQGGGVIEGLDGGSQVRAITERGDRQAFKAYEVSGPFKTDDSFSRFNSQPEEQASQRLLEAIA